MSNYRQAGVDTVKSAQFVRDIAPMIRTTRRPGANAKIGGFGGIFDLAACGFTDPLLIAATDGVGTKLRLAIQTGRHDTIGIDLVAMCVNDLLVQGAEPLFFLDYFAQGTLLAAEVMQAIVAGIVAGCQTAGCALIGGETAEMPGMYQDGDYDLAGFALGAVERDALISPENVRVNDVLLGLPSSGFHSNGYSLIRRVIAEHDLDAPAPFDETRSLGEALLTPTRIYVADVLPHQRQIRGMWHITGGGFYENLERGLSNDLAAYLEHPWPVPPEFIWLAREGAIAPREMCATFNCGVGLVLAVAPENAESLAQSLDGVIIGQLVPRKDDPVIIAEDCLTF